MEMSHQTYHVFVHEIGGVADRRDGQKAGDRFTQIRRRRRDGRRCSSGAAAASTAAAARRGSSDSLVVPPLFLRV